jgi:hypothetical protein
MPTNRRFPAPWTVEDIGAAFVVKDGSGQKLGYFYYEEDAGRRAAILTAIRISEAIVPSAGDDPPAPEVPAAYTMT